MQSFQNILRTFVKSYGLESGVSLNALRNKWTDIVGRPVSSHTCPDMIKGNVLTVIVDTPQWMHHLSFFKEEIISRLSQYNVAEVRFRIGRLPEETKDVQKGGNAALSEDDTRYIENTLMGLKDEELREKFRTLIAHGLTKGKK
ncbi:MAG: DUF721 domain-containing protein [Nitrospirae bacterium]|nr:DUF721 domain-containing protein [Nitrospirota bacterium]